MNYAYTLFGSKNTFSDWGLILKTQSVGMATPEASLDALEIYGQAADQKDVRYKRRAMTFEYETFSPSQFPAIFDEIAAYLHGRKMAIVRSVEPDFTYFGRCRVDPFKSNRGSGTIVITVDAEPFKLGSYVTETFSNVTGKTITVETAEITPAVVKVTPIQTMASLTITGLSRDKIKWTAETIVINDLTANTPVILDGEKDLYTEGSANKYPDLAIWNPPTVINGNNIIGLSSQYVSVEVKYRPRYM